MDEPKQSSISESGVKLETITNKPDMMVPECCRNNWDDCIHKLPEEKKTEYNPV